MKVSLTLPTIPEEEKTPTILRLLDFIEQQNQIILQLSEQNQALKDEISNLKNQPPRPKIRPSSLEKKERKRKSKKKKRPGSQKRHKTVELKIHEDKPVEPENIPTGSWFRGYNDFVVQDIELKPHNIRYRLKVYETPDGKYVSGKLPDHLDGKHFGPTLLSFILYQYYHCHVTQLLLLEQLHEYEIDISKGHLNNIITENKDKFHQEKDRILAVGIEVSDYINVDDTGARHMGKNGYCTYIGNEAFAWFESTESKSRINFLKLLRAGHSDYYINTDAISHMMIYKLPQYVLKSVIANTGMMFANDIQWNEFLADNGIVKEHHIRIATEGALVGSIIEHGISKRLVIVSDDAGQFNVLLHALCWIHAERTIDKIISFTDEAKKDLDDIKERIWNLYKQLKLYKENPNTKDKSRIEAMFENIFTTETHNAMLNQALKHIGAIYRSSCG